MAQHLRDLTRLKFIDFYPGLVRLLTFWLIDEIGLSRRFRGFLYGLAMARCGKNFQVCSDVRIWGLQRLSVGDNVSMAPRAFVICIAPIDIESDVMLGPNVVVTSGDHSWVDGCYSPHVTKPAPVRIGRGSWLAANSTVVAGANIGEGVVVTPNSVARGRIPDGDMVIIDPTVCGGVLARARKRS